jgi:hypothetical protein
MTHFKPWYLSKTIWASGISVACALLGFAGVPTGGIDQSALADQALQIISALSGVVAIFGRVSAGSRIG